MSHYRHLTQQQRYHIDAFAQSGLSQNAIAQQLGVHRSTISRELVRNANKHGQYEAAFAHNRYRFRQQDKVQRRIDWPKIREFIDYLLRLHFSPERIVMLVQTRLSELGTFSVEWLYQRIYEDARREGSVSWRYLARSHRKRGRRNPSSQGSRIVGRRSIKDRPEVVDKRERLGDWEIDTVVSQGKQSGMVTIVERKSRLYLAGFVKNLTATAVQAKTVELLKPYQELGFVKTITADNGLEFARHHHIAQALACDFYFADPYRSCQRGCNEHHNGLLRYFFPKGTDFAQVPHSIISAAIKVINSYPKKVLHKKRPVDIMALICDDLSADLNSVALAS